jgi:hypothetical protein
MPGTVKSLFNKEKKEEMLAVDMMVHWSSVQKKESNIEIQQRIDDSLRNIWSCAGSTFRSLCCIYYIVLWYPHGHSM